MFANISYGTSPIYHHCILSICIFSFPHFEFVGRMLSLIVLVPGHCFDFTLYLNQNGNDMFRMTQANSGLVKKRKKRREESIMKLLKFELIEMQKACQKGLSQKQLAGCVLTKQADRLSAVAIETLYSTCN